MSIYFNSTNNPNSEEKSLRVVKDINRTTCCIVGGGPAGAMMALLLARKKIPVTLLELHKDFDRDFRGDTLHPSILEILDELGLTDHLLQLPHTKISDIKFVVNKVPITVADFGRLNTKYPYLTMLPQARFIEFLICQAKQYPDFQLLMGANVRELIEENGIINGVLYQNEDGWHEVRAPLTVGADGRSSRIRRRADLELIKTSSSIDVLWFRLPRLPRDSAGAYAYFGRCSVMILLDCTYYWQVARVIPKGSYPQIRAAGLDDFRQFIFKTAPAFSEHANHLEDWKQVSMLSVESGCLRRWSRPGVLLIGDAAHVMSPVGGVGINYAIQDSVVAANLLSAPLKSGTLRLNDLQAVQRRREGSVRIIQALQALDQRLVIEKALQSENSFSLPLPLRILLRLPFLNNLLAYLMAFGAWRVHVKN
jgi:2-polyprenyl-6-methoxyphenol hydroxylase-like FAD-dependent oxidoreductase